MLINNKFVSFLIGSFKVLGIAVVIFYVIALILLFIFQDSLIFFPQKLNQSNILNAKKKNSNIEDIEITASDSIKLNGWFIKSPIQTEKKLIFYFGGNAEEVSDMLEDFNDVNDWSAVCLNYRGYGNSGGKPSQNKLFSDCLEIYDHFDKKLNLSEYKVVFMGRSLGSGVATYLAANRRNNGVILVTPYDSLKNVAAEQYPFAPVGLLLRHPFNSVNYALNITSPLLVLAASNDTLVPPEHARKLVAQWKGPTKYEEIQGYDHNSISFSEKYWPIISDYLKNIR